MKIEISKRKMLYFAIGFALIVTLGFVFAAKPNPGHSWSELGDLPGKIWHSENDGSGSGLDADTIDGKHASELGGGDCEIVSASCNNYCISIGKMVSSGSRSGTAVKCKGRIVGGYSGCSCWDGGP
ncbi:MAG: hypothetical protein L6408_06310 [Nanoarchaeota archaeon]|nr:hypothetical protein [Nanoarchaeota archaeon]